LSTQCNYLFNEKRINIRVNQFYRREWKRHAFRVTLRFRSYFAVAATLQFRKQRIPRATMPLPSIFAEGDYRRVRLTHPNRLVKYCENRARMYVQARGFYLSRLTM